MHNASTLLQSGKFAQACSVLDSILKHDPNMVEAYRLRAGALLAMGDKPGAEQALCTAVEINPTWAPTLVALGELLADDGRWPPAERALRLGVAHGAKYPRAAQSLSLLLLRMGRLQEAHDVIAPQASATNADVDSLIAYAGTLNALNRFDDEVAAYQRVVRAMPSNGEAEMHLAAAQISAARYSDAAKSARRALDKGADDARTWFVVGSAAIGEDRHDDAQAALHTACERDPSYVDAQRELAQLIWMRTSDLAAATIVLDAALATQPNTQDLLIVKANLYQSVDDYASAYALLADAARDSSAIPTLLLTASEAAIKSGGAGAVEFAERALTMLPGHPATITMLGHALLNAGRAQEAEDIAVHVLQQRPDDQAFVSLFATAQRLRGNAAYHDIHDYAGLVHAWTIDTPQGWADLPSYLADLAISLRRLHTLQTHPVHQSLRHGTQTTQNLAESEDPVIRAFFTAIDGPIRRHMQAIGHGSDPTRRRNTGNYKIHGIWSVQLQPNGYHTNHVHPEGWLSSACYIDLPPAIEHDRQGWLKFGEPGIATTPTLGAEHFIRPAPGLLALFPSHMWHGTVPFTGSGTRLTIAFDVIPA